MGRARVGSIQKRRGAWVARVKYTDESGRVVDVQRRARNKTHAGELRGKLLAEIAERELRITAVATAERDGPALNVETVAQLCDYYEREHVRAPEFRGRSLESGMRSYKVARGYLTIIRAYLGPRTLRSLTYGDLRRMKRAFSATPTIRGRERSHANVNRVLATFRAMLRFAVQDGLMASNPFDGGRSLISIAKEDKRTRILSRDEEARLLAACDAPKRRHLRPLLICALDTGMRRGEILKLRWPDIDMGRRVIRIVATNTKTLTAREAPITARLAEELEKLALARESKDAPVFAGKDGRPYTTIKTSFLAACRDAGIADFRFHDARHSAASRLIEGGTPLVEVSRILGHAVLATSYRYSNTDDATVQRAADVLDRLNIAAATAQVSEAEMTN